MVRSAVADREQLFIFFPPGRINLPRVAPAAMHSWIRRGGSVYHGKFYPKTTIIAFGKNYEQPFCIKILSGKDPLRRIESCIAPGLPANGR
jgi:hypothetical protein